MKIFTFEMGVDSPSIVRLERGPPARYFRACDDITVSGRSGFIPV